ncbi:hypothetical protein ACVJGD_008225 [Bradyrhizobium sp. USDA 10063]
MLVDFDEIARTALQSILHDEIDPHEIAARNA